MVLAGLAFQPQLWAVLETASPLTHIEQIKAPLFVIHGRNDPRVPVSEAEQLVANLRQRGIRTTLCIYEDEGHGLARLENRLGRVPARDRVLGRGAQSRRMTRRTSCSPSSRRSTSERELWTANEARVVAATPSFRISGWAQW